MKKLNKNATATFMRLLQLINNKEHVKLLSEGFMPLVMEKLHENIHTEYGEGTLFSLAHYYTQNGDAMRDPEMCFLAVDLRESLRHKDYLFVFPTMYQQDNLGIYEESVTIENNTVTSYKPAWQQAHAGFANLWMKNIQQQGFLK